MPPSQSDDVLREQLADREQDCRIMRAEVERLRRPLAVRARVDGRTLILAPEDFDLVYEP